jgi:hypothetical protein
MPNRRAIFIAGALTSYAGLVAIFLLAMPGPLGSFEYLVAGAFATGVCLMIGFCLYAKATFGRTSRKGGRSS